MFKRCLISVLALCLFICDLKGQDTLMVMSLRDYYSIILQNHPLASQANSVTEEAQSLLRMARGAFDPSLKTSFDQKRYNEKDYWSMWESGLQIPLWFGADVKVAYEDNRGFALDNNQQLPEDGLSYLGLSVPLGQGLLLDQRRSAVRQALLAVSMADAEKVQLINKLLLQAARDFWNWNFTFNRMLLHEEGLRLAQVRFDAVRDRVLFGDLPAVDSLEAFIEFQNRKNILTQSAMEASNARLIAANHLWTDEGMSYLPDEKVIPVLEAEDLSKMRTEDLSTLLSGLESEHPDLLRYDFKLKQLDIDRRLAAERLRPKLNLDYNLLSQGKPLAGSDESNWNLNSNYKWGFQFNLPVFLRQERGKLNLTKIKIKQTEWESKQAARDIRTRINTNVAELDALAEQISIQEEQVRLSGLMLEAEQFRFTNGEGSIFLVNARENVLLNSKIRLAELKTRFAIMRATLYWNSGNLARMTGM